MRYKVKSGEVAHLWAHQTQDHAEAPSAMSFRGPDFYSYSTVIGSIVTDASGNRVYLISEARYSITTSGHMSQMRQAIPDSAKQFHVPGCSTGCSDLADSKRIMDAWRKQIEYTLEDAGKSRQPKKNRLLGEAAETLQRMRDYAEAFGLKSVEFPVIAGTPEELATWVAEKDVRDKAAQRKLEQKRKREHARLQREYAADREAWLRGDTPKHYGWYQHFPTELRVIDGEVETSRGVTFPLDHARKGLKLVESVIKTKTEWQTNGHTCHLGHYQIERITPDGTVYAGCHKVHYNAIARIREQLVRA